MIALKESSFLFKSILIFASVERSALNGKAIYDSDSILLTAQTLIPPGWAETLSTARFPSGYEFRDYWDRGSVFQDKHFLNAVILEKDNFVGCHPSSLSLSCRWKKKISREFCDNEWDYQVSWLTFNRYGGGARKCKLYELFQFEKAVEILEKRIFMQSTVTNVRCYLNNTTF